MRSKEKTEIGKALRIILTRSFIYISLLVIIVATIYFWQQAKVGLENTGINQASRIKIRIAIVDGRYQYKKHIRALRFSLIRQQMHTIPCFEYNSLNKVGNEEVIYILGTDKVNQAIERLPGRLILGYADFREKPIADYTGIFSGFDWPETLKVYKQVLPNLKTIGLLYTEGLSSEAREEYGGLQTALKDYPYSSNLKIIATPVSAGEKEIKEKLNSLLPQIDALLVLVNDKNIETHLPLISSQALAQKIPFLGGGDKGAQLGALIAFDYNQDSLGKEAARIMARIIKSGHSPADIPIIFPKSDIFINLSTSYKLNITIPSHILAEARGKYH